MHDKEVVEMLKQTKSIGFLEKGKFVSHELSVGEPLNCSYDKNKCICHSVLHSVYF